MSESVTDKFAGESSSTDGIPTSLGQSLWRGGIGFCGVSLLVFATVAFAESWMYKTLGVGGAYATWTLLFLLPGAIVFAPLVKNKRRLHFYLLFSLAFLLYAIGWMSAWFLLRGRLGEWLGALVGSALMALVFVAGFGAWRVWLKVIVVLFIANSFGYFIGEMLYNLLSGKVGMLLWGAVYGFAFGIGLGAVLYYTQASIRERLR